MNDRTLPFALRQLRRDFERPVTWCVLLGIGVILGLAGAFGTGDALRLLPRILYWMALAVLSYGLGSFITALVRPRFKTMPIAARVVFTGVAIGVPMTLLVMGINTVLFNYYPRTPAEGLGFAGTIVVVCIVISAVLEVGLFGPAPSDTSPAILDRLAVDNRAPLVSISVEDHYVRIRTLRGEEMVLMRLGDAIKEAGSGGLQVHRSHWVARDQIASAAREGDRAVLTMRAGPAIPVSRRYVPQLREAGLLP